MAASSAPLPGASRNRGASMAAMPMTRLRRHKMATTKFRSNVIASGAADECPGGTVITDNRGGIYEQTIYSNWQRYPLRQQYSCDLPLQGSRRGPLCRIARSDGFPWRAW